MAEPSDQGRPYKNGCIGDKYERCTVVAYDKLTTDGKRTVRIDCVCGTKNKRVRVHHLADGSIVSCGCHRDEQLRVNRRSGRSTKNRTTLERAEA